MTPLPIDDVLPQVVDALRGGPCVVLRAPTGAGKTTRVPPALLDAGLAGGKQILLVQPRRLAARAAARWMARERGVKLGEEVGYQVRFDRRCTRDTKIVAMTPGILLARLHDEPFLESAGIVVFDEFHERGLESDLALGLTRLIQQSVRPELRMVVMSATLAVEQAARYLDNCPIIESQGRMHPVALRYEPRPSQQSWPAAVADAVSRVLQETSGDVLAFLPGVHEIRQTARELEPLAQRDNLLVLPLYGDLPPERQDVALLPQPQRRVVLATNVAETSVTVEGITGVVDSGLERQLVYNPHLGLDRLQSTHISQASADQRAGRAGRTQPGMCIRLWSQSSHRMRPEQAAPEIRRVDLSAAVLQLISWGESDLRGFPWLEAPPEETCSQAIELLRRLGALRDNRITELGRRLARLPVHPRLGRMLLEAARLGHAARGALAAALLSERDPFARQVEQERVPARPRPASPSDVLDRVEALEAFEANGRYTGPLGVLHRGGAKHVLQARDHLLRMARHVEHEATAPAVDADEAVMRAVLAAYPDRLCRRREPRSRRGVMVGGRGVRLLESSSVLEPELFVAVDVDAGSSEALVRQASAVERGWISADQLRTAVEVEFDDSAGKIVARRRVRFLDLALEESPAALPDDEEAARVLAAAAARRWEEIRPADDSPAGQYLLRLRLLRELMPQLDLPELKDDTLRSLLEPLCRGCRSLDDVRCGNWLGAIGSLLTYQQRQAVAREAPERLEVPSGSRIALRYEAGRPPVLPVRIQELFGLADTPRIVGGRLRVLLELLGPNYRPQQVTDDLASFWANTYPQVRKELRARYPRHAWPENPREATPRHRPQQK